DPLGLAGGLNPYGYVHNPVGWVDPWGLNGTDATGRPLSSPNYSVWYQTEIPEELHSGSRSSHFRNANGQLYNTIQNNPELKGKLPAEVINHVQPGARGGFKGNSPPGHSWHHNAQDPTKIELIPRPQHQAPGEVQKSLHPKQEGGFKKLQEKTSCK
ncbi:HNH endonuclease, partial [Xenorhabdus budapestensis]|uniref:HNH endonuclease n=1 Tax=Xenorhabdus budapestensis TaxID=290110 RepID=UPI001B8092B2